jgi:hypothetical protein
MHAPTMVTRNDRPSRTARESGADAPDGLDWQSFSSRYFPGSRRHNLKALTTYGTYRTNSHASLEPQNRERTYPKRRAPAQDAEALAAVAMQAWEAEGGSAQ